MEGGSRFELQLDFSVPCPRACNVSSNRDLLSIFANYWHVLFGGLKSLTDQQLTGVIPDAKTLLHAWLLWRTPLIPALGRQRQADSEFKTSLVYRVSSRTPRAIQRNPVSKNQTTTTTKQNKTKKQNKKKILLHPAILLLLGVFFSRSTHTFIQTSRRCSRTTNRS